jgi:tripartite-type tricarboxylate transporter receptor subunit TctC
MLNSTRGKAVLNLSSAVRTLLVLAFSVPALAAAQGSYPDKPIRLMVPFPAGGLSDVTARVVLQKLSEHMGQPVVIDNRAGASGNIGADIAAKATPDGHTLLINAINFVINPSVIKPPFDPVKDFAGVSLIANGPAQVVTVSSTTPWKSVKDVIAAAKAQPGKLNFGTSGLGSSAHLTTELLKSMTGIDVVQVPFKGAALSLSSVLTGDVAVVFPSVPVVMPHLKTGRLRALAVTSGKRTPALPDVPTMTEAGLPGFDIDNFLGLLAPVRTPRPIVKRLSSEIADIVKQPDIVERYAAFGMQPVGSTPEEMDRFTRDQLQKWSQVLRRAGYTPK